MRRQILFALLITSIAVTGCSRAPQPAQEFDTAELELQRRQATERSLAAVVEVARELRDRRGGVTPPAEPELIAELRRRASSAGRESAIPNDAWGRPLRYERLHERDGDVLRNGFRVTSAGPNGTFESGRGDDLHHSAIVTERVRGE